MPPLFFLEAVQVSGLTTHRTPANLLPVEALLRERGYDNARVRAAIIDYLDATGSAEGFVGLDEADRAAVARLLPARLRTEHGCVDGCRDCEDAARFRSGLLVPTTKGR